MTAVLTMDIQELNTQFVEELKHQFAHSDVEIRVHERPNAASAFTVNDFWHIIEKLDWSKEGDDDAVVEPVVKILQSQPLAHIYRFSDILSEKLWHLDARQYAQVFLKNTEGVVIYQSMIFYMLVVQLLQMDAIFMKKCYKIL